MNTMLRSTSSRHARSAAAALLALGVAACAGIPAVRAPDALAPSAQESLAMVAAARGVQIYECRMAKAAGSYEWAFVAPEADLFDARGRHVGTHGAGPTWIADDGSRVVGTVKARADAPQANAIPWLLLDAKSVGGDGRLSRVTSIRRVNTIGGAAPAVGCGKETVGTSTRVSYVADYQFFVQRS